MNKFLKLDFLEKEIKIEVNNLTMCDIVKAVTCLLEDITTESWAVVRKALSEAETKHKENKND